MKCLPFFLLLFVFALPGLAKPLTLVADGKARAAIVVAVNEAKAEKAAQELQKYIAKMSGATLPIIKEGDPLPQGIAVSVLVGHTAAAQKLKVKVPAGFDPSIRKNAFSEEGYVLRTSGNNLVVGGNADGPYQGTLYAAYALLEKLGCRWFFPGEWGEVIPSLTTIVVPELNVTSRPDFAVRGIWLSGWVPITGPERTIYAEWGTRIGFTQGTLYPMPGDGYLAGLLPPAEYYNQHPEYFAMNKQGKREAPANLNQVRYAMLCMSNPDVLAESIKNLKAAFAGQKKLICTTPNGVGISPPDGAPYCYCEKCLAASQNFDYPTYFHERLQSEEFYSFAANIAKEFPDKWVATAGYALREFPPQGVKLPPNIQVMYAPISSCVLHPGNDPHCWRRMETMKILANWSKLTSHITIYDYNSGMLCGLFVPECDVANFTANAPMYKQLGIKGFNTEGRKAFMQTWISYYIRGKLMWDAHADVNALKKDFYNTFFGPEAGPHVQAWWDACEEALANTTMHAHEDWLINHIYTADFTGKIHAHIEAARKAKMTDAQRGHFDAVALIADHLEAYAAMEEADKRMDYAAAATAAGRMLDDMRKLEKINSFLFTVNEKNMQRTYFCGGRQTKYQALAAMTDGTKGTQVAALPLEMKFTRDRFNQGVIGEWYNPNFDDAAWGTKNTFYTWDAQDKPEDEKGHDYDGYGWYRGAIDVPEKFIGKPIRFWSGGAINEAWVWINGEYAGHKAHQIWWLHPHDFELDVSKLLRPGRNTIAIRVWNNAEIGGLYRRGFFWAPKE